MALEGSIKDFGLADIFQLIHLQKKTGVLTVKNPSHHARVQFEGGMVVTASTTDADSLDKIGEVLSKAGRVKSGELQQAMERHNRTQEKIGAILVQMGAVSKEDLVKALTLQLNEIVYSLFKWKEGQYSFEPCAVSYHHDYSQPVNTEFLLMEGVRRVDEWPFIEKKIPDLGMVFVKNPANAEKIKGVRSEEDAIDAAFGDAPAEEGIKLTEDEMKIYNIIDGKMDVRYLSEVAQLGEFETCKALSNLLTVELISALEVPHSPHVEADSPKRARSRDPILTRRVLGSLVAIAGLALGTALNVGSMGPSFSVFNGIDALYNRLKIDNELILTESAIRTYYYMNISLPDSINSLLKNGYLNYPGNGPSFLGEIQLRSMAENNSISLIQPGQQ